MNRLSHERSPYLRHASNQGIDWYPWCDEAFERAQREDKPVFLSTGAVWCHWCHVMAKESFGDEGAVKLLNELFISIKLDRDERPDIDRRYQQAVAAMGSGGGWPLSVFLTPDREPFFGGTYFPPEDRQGMPGFKSVLSAVSNFYRTKRGEVAEYARRIKDALATEPLNAIELSDAMLVDAEQSMLAVFDKEHGGFGSAPKFPMPGALEFLIRRSAKNADPAVGHAAQSMLHAMALGGFHDHLGGGFHRYSVDEAWTIPHFEKMADDNAGLLGNYIDGYAAFGDELFHDIAMDVIAFTRGVLSDPEGGFYASQDADVTPDDEGGYFTWTEEEFKKPLDPEEYADLSLYLMHEQGTMHHDPEKKVLHVRRPAQDLAARLGKNVEEVQQLIQRGKKKLLVARAKRETPFIDRTLYTSLNGMMISAYFHAYAVLGHEGALNFGMKSLERIMRERYIGGSLFHAEGVPAGLDDYVHLIAALVAGYEASAESRFLRLADVLMEACIEKFVDRIEGGFFDTEGEVLGTRLKRIEDVPQPSANAVVITLLLKLSLLTNKEEYRRIAEQSLKIFASTAAEMGVHGGAYFCALDAWFGMIKLTVEAAPDSGLARASRALSGTLHCAIEYGEDNNRVIPCKGTVCREPIYDPKQLKTALQNYF